MIKRKLEITLEVLHEVSVELPETKQLIEEHLEQKCLKEDIPVEEVIYFLFRSLEVKSLRRKHFLLCSVRF